MGVEALVEETDLTTAAQTARERADSRARLLSVSNVWLECLVAYS